MCSHPRTGDATDEKIAEKNREKFNELNFLRLNHGLVRGWLHRRFSPRAGDASISKKSHHHRKQKIARVAAALRYCLRMNVYTPYVAMELTNDSSLKNFIGCSRTLRSMNSCYFFPPQSFFFLRR